MPEPINQSAGSNVGAYECNQASYAFPIPAPETPRPVDGADPPEPSPAAVQLARAHSLLPTPSLQCLDEAADALKGAGMLVAAGAVLVGGTATLGPVGAFIGASVVFAVSLAKYENCEDDAAQKAMKHVK